MSIKLQLNSIPPEIWNCILFFTEHQDLELIRFLMYHQITFNLCLDVPKIKEFYQRNIKPIRTVLKPINFIQEILHFISITYDLPPITYDLPPITNILSSRECEKIILEEINFIKEI